ncbi:hypothetical protein ACMGE7_07635 [Macrococcus equi]|uniref:hypothetical protein n=1 Tax=Macrococcus equi TaxID=3395462 RepID=UPI0039BE2771
MKKIRGKKRIFQEINNFNVDEYQISSLGYCNIYIPQFTYVDDEYKNEKLLYSVYKSFIEYSKKRLNNYCVSMYINRTKPMNSQLIIQADDYWNNYKIDNDFTKCNIIRNLEKNLNIHFEKIREDDALIWIARI